MIFFTVKQHKINNVDYKGSRQLRILFRDRPLRVHVNAKIRDGSEVSELMEVFVEDDAYNDKFPVTSRIKRRFKETEEGQGIMCEIIEKLCSEAKAEGWAEGQAKSRAHINKLNAMLIDSGRYDDLKRSTTDVDYQTMLIHELLLEEMA